MVYVVMAYLWVSILLYLLLGGADFGAGIIELFTSDRNKDRTADTMGKVNQDTQLIAFFDNVCSERCQPAKLRRVCINVTQWYRRIAIVK